MSVATNVKGNAFGMAISWALSSAVAAAATMKSGSMCGGKPTFMGRMHSVPLILQRLHWRLLSHLVLDAAHDLHACMARGATRGRCRFIVPENSAMRNDVRGLFFLFVFFVPVKTICIWCLRRWMIDAVICSQKYLEIYYRSYTTHSTLMAVNLEQKG